MCIYDLFGEVCVKIQEAIGPHRNLLTIVKRPRLQQCGHVSRLSGLAKTISQGTVKGGRRQGRQRKRWEDNIREWTGLEFSKSHRTVENMGKWRKLVAKSSVVPQRPSQLRIDDDDDNDDTRTRQVHVALLFLINRQVRDGVWKLGNPALFWLTGN